MSRSPERDADPQVSDASGPARPVGSSGGPVQRVAVLGATGSIGTATLDVLRHLQSCDSECRWDLAWASTHQRVQELSRHLRGFSPSPGVIVSGDACPPPDDWPEILRGPEGLVRAAEAENVDIVVAAIVGVAGLDSTMAAARAGKRIALANKETLVVAGPIVTRQAAESGAELLPIDSEHSAIFQSLPGPGSPVQRGRHAKRLILTASGGPFRNWTPQQMRDATPQQAMRHPTWDMGQKITIDSATMMNKALEIIEARWLFDVPAESIEVMIHPQSIIHSMIETADGSVIAQMSPPDMKLPIQLALTHPRRVDGISDPMDWTMDYRLDLQAADLDRFPALAVGFEVARVGGTAGAVVNAANEEAVGLFLDGRIRFTDIVAGIQAVLDGHDHETDPTLRRLMELDDWARQEFRRWAAA